MREETRKKLLALTPEQRKEAIELAKGLSAKVAEKLKEKRAAAK